MKTTGGLKAKLGYSGEADDRLWGALKYEASAVAKHK